MTDNLNKMIVGLALAALAGVPAFAQNPSPGCDDGEVLINGECTELEDTIIVTGSRDGSSGGQSGLGGGTGSTSQGSSSNGYAGRPGGGSSGGNSGPDWSTRPRCVGGYDPAWIDGAWYCPGPPDPAPPPPSPPPSNPPEVHPDCTALADTEWFSEQTRRKLQRGESIPMYDLQKIQRCIDGL